MANTLSVRAIDEVSDQQVNRFGHRHADTFILQVWPEASNQVNGSVDTVAIGELLREEGVVAAIAPLIVKLDVEGVELQALKGAARIVRGKSAWLIEDADVEHASDAITFAVEKTGYDGLGPGTKPNFKDPLFARVRRVQRCEALSSIQRYQLSTHRV